MRPFWALLLCLACAKEKEAPPVEAPPRDLAEHAERLGRRLTEPAARALLTAELGSAFARLGAAEAGLSYLDEATTQSKGLTPSERESVMSAVVAAQAYGGRVELARKTAAQIGSRNARSEALVAIVDKLAADKKYADARTIIDVIPDPTLQSHAKVSLVKGLLAGGKHDLAGQTAARIENPEKRDEAIAAVAVELFERRRLARAHSALASLRSPHWRGEATAAMARMRYRSGATKRAKEITKSIESDWIRARTYADLSGLAARKGRRRRAQRLMDRSIEEALDIKDSVLRASALTDIAIRLIDRGRIQDAQAVLQRTQSKARRKAEAHLAGWYAKNGQLERALEIHAGLAVDVIYGSEAASAVARALADKGDIVRALETAGQIKTQELRLPALAEIAVRHALLGKQPDDALRARLEKALFQTPS